MKPQSKIFLVINKNDKGDGRGQSSWFSNGLQKKIYIYIFYQQLLKQQTNGFLIKQTNTNIIQD